MSNHELTLGDICTVKGGKHADKRVLVIKSGIQTKFGIKVITVEYRDFNDVDTSEKVWVSPEQLVFNGEVDTETAEKVKEADYQDWKSRRDAGVPPKSSFNKKPSWGKKSDGESDNDFR